MSKNKAIALVLTPVLAVGFLACQHIQNKQENNLEFSQKEANEYAECVSVASRKLIADVNYSGDDLEQCQAKYPKVYAHLSQNSLKKQLGRYQYCIELIQRDAREIRGFTGTNQRLAECNRLYPDAAEAVQKQN